MSKRETPEVNAGSMADIAFLLLIFFLVTTTLDVDTGLPRILPEKVEEQQENVKIKERNLFVVLLNSQDLLLVEGEHADVEDLKERALEFIVNPTGDANLSEGRTKEIEPFGQIRVSKGVISMQTDRGTSYKKYIAVQNELIAAYNELRNKLSMEKFGKTYDELREDEPESAKAIREAIPQQISEAEPKRYGKN